MKFEKWMAGYYRLSGETRFAGIKRERDGWQVEIRDSDTGTLQRYAGIWPTLREARAEAERVLNPPTKLIYESPCTYRSSGRHVAPCQCALHRGELGEEPPYQPFT